ncbi:Fatty-acid-binding protein 2 [Apostasia shenzhenica]|uniref:Chalcone--flavanone isomerase n=1 Tax=Apostasia shenzhenica TaxID=1088818 RepID=A0A2I0A207_9ASPA|nr:Fatty-acid-binding protein 2 [Apostasia shenzhenica]
MDRNGGRPYIFSIDSDISQGPGAYWLSQFCSFVDMSLYSSNHLFNSGSLALQEALSCISKFAGVVFVWLSSSSKSSTGRRTLRSDHGGSNSCDYQSHSQIKQYTCRKKIEGLHFNAKPDVQSAITLAFAKLANSTAKRLWKELGQTQAFPVLSLAAALIPPFDNLSSKVLSDSIPLGTSDDQMGEHVDHQRSEGGCYVCDCLAISSVAQSRDAVEPNTGIKFPGILDKFISGDYNRTTEVLVGTGFRNLRVIKLKSLKVYAFGLYVNVDSVCEKLGLKYVSVPINELQNCSDFYEDLLREDIGMTVRLVVNCNGLKISTVRDAFEKSLRIRLQKMNPDTDYHCLTVFGSYFMQDIPLPVGTTIDFRRTADGRLITEIGDKHIGAVHSKDLCRAFFDMYIGDIPVSVQAKQNIAQNVAGLLRRC